MLDEQIEALRARVHDIAVREQGLVRSLGETLTLAEDRLLQHVREIAAQHVARRAEVLGELQGLAARIGTFPRPENDNLDLDRDGTADLLASEPPQAVAIAAGDWRRAASIIAEDEQMVEILHARMR